MSDFARGVVGVFVIGLVVGAGALMFLPKSSPSATQTAGISAPACAPNSPRKSDPACQKSTAQHRDSGKTDRRGGAGPEQRQQRGDERAHRCRARHRRRPSNRRPSTGRVAAARDCHRTRAGNSRSCAEPAPPAPVVAAPQVVAAPAAAGRAGRRAVYTTARRAAPAQRTARRAYASTRNRGVAMGFPFFPMFR